MVFKVPASKQSVGQDQFTFEIGEDEFSIKKAKFISIGQLELLESNATAALNFFGEPGTKQGIAVRTLEREQFQALVEAWREDSEVTSGESPASAS